MSGMTGIWNVNGAPVSRELLAAMSARLVHRGPDGETTLLSDAAGFAYQALRETPESLAEVQPARLVTGAGPIVMLDGRLDNRAELLSTLPAHPPVNRESSDSTFVLATYAAYGDDFARHLHGDFALALFDPVRPRLFLARDILGARTLHYCRFGDHFLFASEIKALLTHPAVKTKPNDRSLAEWHFQIPDYGHDNNTFFVDIFRVPAGKLVTATPSDTEVTQFWDFDPGKELRLAKYSDYVEAYRATFTQAVQRRMRSAYPVSISVSGGLDSSSIYCVAQALRQQPGVADILGIALVGEHPSVDEKRYQDLIEEKYGDPLVRIPFGATETLSDAGLVGAGVFHAEGPYLKWDVWRRFFQECVARGSRVTLSGFFGDQLLTNPQYLIDLVAQGRWLTTYRHLRRFYSWWEGHPPKESTIDLYAGLKGYLVPERLRPLFHRWRRQAQKRNVDYFAWFSDRFAAIANEVEAQRVVQPVPPSRAHAKILYQHAYAKIPSLRLDLDLKTDAQFPCTPAYPFRDRDLIALLMAVPGEIVYQSGCRGIHRDAMQGILPEAIRVRQTKAVFQQVAKQGAMSDLDQLSSRLPRGLAAAHGYLAPAEQLRQALDELREDLEASQTSRATWLALDLLSLEQWLQAYFGGGQAGTGLCYAESVATEP